MRIVIVYDQVRVCYYVFPLPSPSPSLLPSPLSSPLLPSPSSCQVLYRDLDGTLTGQPGGGWVLPNSDLAPPQHCARSVPEFSVNSTVANGTVCSSDVNFLRMAWNRAQPLVRTDGGSGWGVKP